MNSEGIAYVVPVLAGDSEITLSRPDSSSDKRARPEELSSVGALQNDQTDEALLAEVGRGSKDALAFLFRRHRRAVLCVASRILRDASEAEDLCQEVFLFLFEKAKLFDVEKGTASSWIIQIAYHRAMKRREYLAFRQHYNVQELNEEQLHAEHPQSFINEIVGRTLLNRFREQLSVEQQRTLELHFFEGYSFREIAEKTGETFGNIRHHYYRGLERLRSLVFPHEDV